MSASEFHDENNLLLPIPNISNEEYQSLVQNAVGCGMRASDGVVKSQWQGRPVAVKRFDRRSTPVPMERILNELRMLARCIGHPNVVQLLAAGPDLPSRCSFHLTEYADCGSLEKVLHYSPDVSYTLAHAVSWALQAAQALDFLHHTISPPHCHGDVKPANMLLFDGGTRLKLSDFGASGSLGIEQVPRPATLVYTAPEIAYIRSGVDLIYTTQCDVYSWTVSLWEMLARKRPYESGQNSKATFWSIFASRLPTFNNCPEALRVICEKGLSSKSEERPSMKHAADVLRFSLDKILARGVPLCKLDLHGNASPVCLTKDN